MFASSNMDAEMDHHPQWDNVSDTNTNDNQTMTNTNISSQDYYLNITEQISIKYAIPLNGYFFPILFVITIVANTLIVVVLSKRHMRTPTNAVLLAMALSDMLTILFPAPWYLYMYTFGNHYKPLNPVAACYAYHYMQDTIPTLFHTASIWLTLALAVQRYIYVCHAPVARLWCTMPRVLTGICLIYALASLHQFTRFFERYFYTDEILWEGSYHEVCYTRLAHWVQEVVTPNVYFNFYFWTRVFFIHLIPCITLIVLNLLLFRAMRQAQKRREQLFKDNKKTGECKKLRDSNSTTIMLIVVVTVFLLVESPLAVLTILHIISSSVVEFLNYEIVDKLILFSNFFIVVSYPINFAIYCGMSRQFRETFKDLFVRGSSTSARNGSSRYSMVNGPRTCTNETVL